VGGGGGGASTLPLSVKKAVNIINTHKYILGLRISAHSPLFVCFLLTVGAYA